MEIKKLDLWKFSLWIQEQKEKYLSKTANVSINTKEKIDFFDTLANLVVSGIPITNALNIMLYQTKNKNLKTLLSELIKDVNKWKIISDSLKNFPLIFSQFDLYMIKMWEVTGKMWNSFELIRDREEKNNEIKSKIIGALIYPTIIISLSIIMIIGFMVFVIPKVQKMYVDARVNLPWLTQSVIDISVFLQNNFIMIGVGIATIIALILQVKKHPSTREGFDNMILNFPIFGPLLRKRTLAIFTSTFWTLLQNGIMIHEALDISKKSMENFHYEKRFQYIIEQINEWIKLSQLFGIDKLKDWYEDPDFPIELASITKIWEQTGKLPSLLIKISYKYNREIDTVVKGIQTAIEPIVIIIVWAIIGTMIMAILLPFFNMVNVM